MIRRNPGDDGIRRAIREAQASGHLTAWGRAAVVVERAEAEVATADRLEASGDAVGAYLLRWFTGVRERPWAPALQARRAPRDRPPRWMSRVECDVLFAERDEEAETYHHGPLIGQDVGLWSFLPTRDLIYLTSINNEPVFATVPDVVPSALVVAKNPLLSLFAATHFDRDMATWAHGEATYSGYEWLDRLPRRFRMPASLRDALGPGVQGRSRSDLEPMAVELAGRMNFDFDTDLVLALRAHQALGWPMEGGE